MNPLRTIARKAGNWYIRYICDSEFNRQAFTHHNERPIEYRFALECLGAARPINVLDVGTGTTSWPHLLHNCGFQVTSIDNGRDYWEGEIVNRHWKVQDVDITNLGKFRGPYDAVICVSVIEHIVDHEAAVRNMLSLLVPGGQLILTTPYNHREYSPNVYKRPDAFYGQDTPYICRSHSINEIETWLRLGLQMRRRELWQLFSGPVWATGGRTPWRLAQCETEPHQLGCFEFIKS